MKPKYGRKKKNEIPEREIIVEPARMSILDVLETNLKRAKRVTYVHRLLYVGEHTFEGTTIVGAMEAIYKQTNSGYCTEPLSGILLYYHRFFCCIVDGSEEVLYKHLNLLFDQYDDKIQNIKLLSAVHHIKGRFLDDWMFYGGKPSERIEEIDPESDLENSMRYAEECCDKLFNFANAYIKDQLMLRERVSVPDEENDEGPDPEDTSSRISSQERIIREKPVRRPTITEVDLYADYLPELKLLNFLVHCKHVKDLREYRLYYDYIGQSTNYSMKVWPAPMDMIPYDVFEKPYDPVSDLPSDLPTTEKNELLSLKEEETIESVSTSSKQA